MKMRIKVGGKTILAEECNSWTSQLRGLMFRSDLKPIVFRFKGPVRIGIHSFFVKNKFLAIWMLGEKVVGKRVVRPWTFFVRPRHEFDSLLEIPFIEDKDILKFLDGS